MNVWLRKKSIKQQKCLLEKKVCKHTYNFYLLIICFFLSSCFLDAHRALELLEDYCSQLNSSSDKQLKLAIERLINVFKSKLFQALLGE